MKIAVTYENGEIFQHFGHTKQFKIYEFDYADKIVDVELVDTNGSGHGALATFLKERDVQVLICGGIGGGAQDALNKEGIKIYGGVQGSCDKAANDFIAGRLEYNPDVKCNHHGEHHNCGNHSCSSHDDSAPKYIPIK